MKRLTLFLATISMLAAPLASVRAASLSVGDLIKASGAAVYYYNVDGKRYVFPNEKTYATWYANFNSVKTITDGELAAIQIGGNVTYKPGVKLVKLTTDPKVYAVEGSNALRWVQTESLAVSYYGADWARQIDDLPDAFFADYQTGTAITSTTAYSRTHAIDANPTISSILAAAASKSEFSMTQTKGTDFSIDFASNPTTGYDWTAAFSPSQFVQVSDTYIPSTPILAGSGGTDRFTFTPLLAGTWDIVFSYARSWETGVAPIDVRTYHVNVAEPTAPTTPAPTSTVQGTFTLTPSKTQAQGNESLDLLAETDSVTPVTKIEIFIGDTLQASCNGARSCSTSFTLPLVGLPDAYQFTAKFYLSNDGVTEAHASVQVMEFPLTDNILLTIDRPQIRPDQPAGISVYLATGFTAAKIFININGLDRKTCTATPCRYNELVLDPVGTVHTVYAWVQTSQGLRYKGAAQTLTVAENETPTITLTAGKDAIYATETVNVTATADDPDGIAWIEISRDGTVLKTCNGATPCTVTVGPFGLSAGSTVAFSAATMDLVGNTASTTGATVTIIE